MHHDIAGLELFEADIRRESSVLAKAAVDLRAEATKIAATLPGTPSQVYLVGCGDSLDAGIAARYVWGRLLGVSVEAVPAMTFASSIAELAPPGSLVVALSLSGKVSRVVEAVRTARNHDLVTVTITMNDGSPLATEPSDASWVLDFDKLGPIPGTTSHLVGAIALYELGCALSQATEARDELQSELDGLGDLVGQVVRDCGPVAEQHAAVMARELPVLTIGYGPSLSSARFTVRKMLELTQLISMWQETEEYAHDEYSLVDSRFRVMQFAPPDRGRARNLEIARYLRRLGVHLAVVTDGADADWYDDLADIVYRLPACSPSLMPLLYAVPGQLLALASAKGVGGSFYGMAEQVHREDGDPQIYESEIAS
jgi:glucosamine 6-phosphate synthetase-like amidotransferase/phosphosugar isomerase protein